MNKELILKYKAEFDHTLSGGEITYKFTDDDLGWRTPTTCFPVDPYSPDTLLIVINDEYVEPHKAGAEGKQLQVSYDNGKHWYNKLTHKINWSGALVRIKPEEPKFKAGDWVREIYSKHANIILEILEENIRVRASNMHTYTAGVEDFELWKPQQDEWCWNLKTRALSIVKQVDNDDYYISSDSNGVDSYGAYNLCDLEPFIGTLPSHLKDK